MVSARWNATTEESPRVLRIVTMSGEPTAFGM
jgi:hypothetical protein